ncbi:MAG: secretin N-terminal domain-containing protein [Pseudomonadota bacterium]
MKSVVVISPQPEYIDQAEAWIKRFDRQASATDRELFVYNVQYSTAEELASVVQSVLTGRSNPTSRVSTVAPGLDPATVTRDGVIDPPAPVIQSFGSQGRPGSGLSSLSNVQIYPYETKNALVIVATQDEYARVLKMLESLDVVSNQVLLEATIVEVSLRDELSRGIQWFFNSGNYDVTFSDATNGAVGSVFPGFSFVFDDGDAQAALNALASLTDVKVLSSPSIMVLDNHTATLQVGDQVPVTTQSASSIDAINTAIVNSVSFRDTGVILTITPRVNENGLVRLDIEQEVSDVVETVSSGIDSPTIQQRRISTTVAVHDGDSLALGGLIEDSTTVTDTAVPYISAVPLVGELFKSTNEIEDRTELMILIKPRVIRNRGEAQAATEEYRSRLRGLDRFNDALELEPLDDAGE